MVGYGWMVHSRSLERRPALSPLQLAVTSEVPGVPEAAEFSSPGRRALALDHCDGLELHMVGQGAWLGGMDGDGELGGWMGWLAGGCLGGEWEWLMMGWGLVVLTRCTVEICEV